jgi:hypothetical protein
MWTWNWWVFFLAIIPFFVMLTFSWPDAILAYKLKYGPLAEDTPVARIVGTLLKAAMYAAAFTAATGLRAWHWWVFFVAIVPLYLIAGFMAGLANGGAPISKSAMIVVSLLKAVTYAAVLTSAVGFLF